MWRQYLKPRSDIMLREFRTVDGERILESIAKEQRHLNHQTGKASYELLGWLHEQY